MEMERERIEIVEYGKKMSAAGLSRGTSGNISIYDPKTGLMAISPSGIDYFATQPEDVVVMDLQGNVRAGRRKPSSEHGMHAGFYLHKPGIRAVVHTHSLYCTTLACMNQPIEAVHIMIAGAGAHRVPGAPYATFGTPQLAQAAVEACGSSNAVLLANHGMVACGTSLPEAFSLAADLEYVAQLQWQAMCAGKPSVLSAEAVDAVCARFQTYGQGK